MTLLSTTNSIRTLKYYSVGGLTHFSVQLQKGIFLRLETEHKYL